MDWLIAFLALTAMEIVLGIDNIVFIAILAAKLPLAQQARARRLGLMAAMGTRIVLLLSLSFVLGLTQPVFHLTDLGVPVAVVDWLEGDEAGEHGGEEHDGGHVSTPGAEAEEDGHSTAEVHDINGVSWRDMILIGGGLFLILKSVLEIHHKLEDNGAHHEVPEQVSFSSVLIQIAILDVIFSLDSVITAVGMVDEIWVMIAAVVVSIGAMMAFATSVSEFVDRHPTVKMLALSFLILIGVLLVAEGIGTEFNKGYIYFAMAFSLIVEMINLRVRATQKLIPKAGRPAPPTA